MYKGEIRSFQKEILQFKKIREKKIKVSKLKLMEYVQRETKENVEKNIAGNN